METVPRKHHASLRNVPKVCSINRYGSPPTRRRPESISESAGSREVVSINRK
jgi:hypothetical protein